METKKMTELNQKNSGKNIKWHNLTIDRNKLEKMRGHKGMVMWFTGLSGSGKSTLANAVNEVLHLDGLSTYCLLYTSPSPRDRQKSRMPSSA